MVDTVEIKEAETTSEKPVEEKQSTQSVQGLPEKFKSVEEMAKSYSELEKKLGEQSQSKPEVDPVSATKLKGEEPKVEETKQENTLEIAEDAVENAGLNFSGDTTISIWVKWVDNASSYIFPIAKQGASTVRQYAFYLRNQPSNKTMNDFGVFSIRS